MPKYSQIEKNSESGGSDFHGENKPDIHLGSGTGDLVVPYGFVQKLRAWKENRS